MNRLYNPVSIEDGLINPVFIDNIEEWLPITDKSVQGINPWYYISTFGRIFSSKSNKILSPIVDKYGYNVVCLYRRDGTHISQFVHRIVLLEFQYVDNHKDLQCNHRNGKKIDNYISNLEWATPRENVTHAFRTGLSCGRFGENNPMATITNAQAEEIAKLIYSQKYSYVDIANMIGCSSNVVECIANGLTWKKYYNKYNLSSRKRVSRVFTNDQLHHICKYFEDNCNRYKSRKQLYSDTLFELGIEYNDSMRRTMDRILNKERFHSITSQYNY